MAITTKTVAPQAPLGRRLAAPELADDIVAMPLAQMAADSYSLKDQSFELRLVNYSVGEKESKLRFHEMKAKGFVPVKIEELEAGSPHYETMDGHIMVGDCVLMKIPKPLIHGAKKNNWEKAIRRRGFRGATDAAAESATANIRNSGAANSQLKKVSVFVPGQAVIDGLVGTSTDKSK